MEYWGERAERIGNEWIWAIEVYCVISIKHSILNYTCRIINWEKNNSKLWLTDNSGSQKEHLLYGYIIALWIYQFHENRRAIRECINDNETC